MRVAVVMEGGTREPVVLANDGTMGPLSDAIGSKSWGLEDALRHLGPLGGWPKQDVTTRPAAAPVRFGAPLTQPGKIIGVGLNFTGHAKDLTAKTTPMPTIFFKGRHTVVGPGDAITIPARSSRTTSEAELGLIIGRRAHEVSTTDALDHIAGFCCVLDQTAEDILQMDTRLLTLAKNFPGFFAFGPEIVSLDELTDVAGSLDAVSIGTYRNGECVASGRVSDMLSSPAELVSFISHVMPLEPGDVVSTGTPGATVVEPGDEIQCRISGLRSLSSTFQTDAAKSRARPRKRATSEG